MLNNLIRKCQTIEMQEMYLKKPKKIKKPRPNPGARVYERIGDETICKPKGGNRVYEMKLIGGRTYKLKFN